MIGERGDGKVETLPQAKHKMAAVAIGRVEAVSASIRDGEPYATSSSSGNSVVRKWKVSALFGAISGCLILRTLVTKDRRRDPWNLKNHDPWPCDTTARCSNCA